MKLLGCAALSADVMLDEVRELAFAGRPFLVWSDGPDVVALLSQPGDRSRDLLAMLPRVLPEVGP